MDLICRPHISDSRQPHSPKMPSCQVQRLFSVSTYHDDAVLNSMNVLTCVQLLTGLNVTHEARKSSPWQLSVQPSAVVRLHVSVTPGFLLQLWQSLNTSCPRALVVHYCLGQVQHPACAPLHTCTRCCSIGPPCKFRTWLEHEQRTSRSQLPQRSGCPTPILQ